MSMASRARASSALHVYLAFVPTALVMTTLGITPRVVGAQAPPSEPASGPSAQQGWSEPHPAAPETAGYRQAIDEAVAEYAAGHFAEARTLFFRAHQLAPSARTLRGLGMVEFEMRRYVVSVDLLEAALASTVKPLQGNLRAKAEQLLARARRFVGRFVLSVDPPDAVVLVDGARVQLPAGQPLRLQVGEHVIEAQAPGRTTIKQSLSVTGSEDATIELRLPEVAGLTQVTSGAAGSADAAKQDGSLLANPWLWAAVGAAALGTAVGVGIGIANAGDTIVVPPYGGDSGTVLRGP